MFESDTFFVILLSIANRNFVVITMYMFLRESPRFKGYTIDEDLRR